MNTFRSEAVRSEMGESAYEFSDAVVGRTLLLHSDAVQLELDVEERSTRFSDFKSAVGSESISLPRANTTWDTLIDSHRSVLASGDAVIRSNEAIKLARSGLSEYVQEAEVGREKSIGTLMNNLWEEVGAYSSNISATASAIIANAVMEQVTAAREGWIKKADLDTLRFTLREVETSLILAPSLCGPAKQQAEEMIAKATAHRRNLQVLMLKNGNHV